MNTTIFRIVRLTIAAAVAFSLFGCAAVKLPVPTASAETVQKLRADNLQTMKANKFELAPGKDISMDVSQGGLRGSSVAASSGSFSQYLKDEIVTELKAAGLYDENATALINAQLTDSQLDAAIGTGTGRLAAHFTVVRDGKSVYDKELAVEEKWESSFVGTIALPAALNHYSQFYKTLAAKLFQDPDFIKVLAK